MAQSINLIPQEEQQEQRKVKIVKFSSVLSVAVLMVVVGISAYFWNRTSQLEAQIKSTEAEIEDKRKDITNLSEIEVAARTLDAKYLTIDEIFNERRRYSILLDELDKRIPEGTITVNAINFAGDDLDQINLSGEGADYISISNFLDTLSNDNFPAAREGLGSLFYDVTLNSVTLNSSSLDVTYYIISKFSYDLLR